MKVFQWYEDREHPAYYTMKAFFARILIRNRYFIGLLIAIIVVLALLYATQ